MALLLAASCGGWVVAGVKQHQLDGLNGYIDRLIAPHGGASGADARRAGCVPAGGVRAVQDVVTNGGVTKCNIDMVANV